jgi:excinuclease UvrABC helicase subunit UvrB
LLDYNKSQDSQTAAAQRILWGIASLADYNLLGIDPSTVPYEQLNAMVNQDNERKKTELYGLGLTV